ncbi:hypothetical protein TrST_g8418 [Triparma strigata]|uniref:Uncharacterized protein n=1 Tax=Triparma strigata TaxID=1606541 RepID=A0A9W7BMT1_9STRA|nr:hypothetical protein TrST_g8418 [Triparma strigata]
MAKVADFDPTSPLTSFSNPSLGPGASPPHNFLTENADSTPNLTPGATSSAEEEGPRKKEDEDEDEDTDEDVNDQIGEHIEECGEGEDAGEAFDGGANVIEEAGAKVSLAFTGVQG